MKKNLRRLVAICVATTTVLSSAAIAHAEKTELTAEVGFYSPTLTVTVPATLDLEVNPVADTSATSRKIDTFTLASKELKFVNATVDPDRETLVPISLKVEARITNQADDVVAHYNQFTPNALSDKKEFYLEMQKATTAPAVTANIDRDATTPETLSDLSNPWKKEGKVWNLSNYEVGDGVFAALNSKSVVTTDGNVIMASVAAPTIVKNDETVVAGKGYADIDVDNATAANQLFLQPQSTSVALVGDANVNADWQETDLSVQLVYDIKAANATTVTDVTAGTTNVTIAADAEAPAAAVDVTLSGLDLENTSVEGMYIYNAKTPYLTGKSAIFSFDEADANTCEVTDTSSGGSKSAKITIPAAQPYLSYLGGNSDYNGKEQDLVITLSDGRVVVGKLKVTKATS